MALYGSWKERFREHIVVEHCEGVGDNLPNYVGFGFMQSCLFPGMLRECVPEHIYQNRPRLGLRDKHFKLWWIEEIWHYLGPQQIVGVRYKAWCRSSSIHT